MQIFEILLLLISSIYYLFSQPLNSRLEKPIRLGGLVLLLLLHLFLEGLRWQMAPGYLIWLLSIIAAFRSSEKQSSTFLKVMKVVILLVFLIPSVLLSSVFPVFELPETTGLFKVGTKDISVEMDRPEIITAAPDDQRKIMVKVWYPTTDTEGEKDEYIDPAGRSGFAIKYGLPVWMFNYLDKIETHVLKEAAVANKEFPVLIFSHGYHSKANGYYALLSEIASHGYIIFAINHTYESTGTTFLNGTEVYFDRDFAMKIEEGTWNTVAPTREAFKNGLSFDERHPIVREALANYFVKGMIERWATDISEVIDRLENWNNNGFFKGKLDISRIGVFGHSRGGGSAGHALLMDKRIKAGANLDGVQWGAIVDSVFQKPFLFMASDWPADHEDLNSHAYINKSTHEFYEALLLQSGHSSFMDIPFMIPVPALSQAGSIDPNLGFEIINKMTVAFFDNHLKGKEVNIGAIGEEYDLLKLTIHQEDSLK